MPIRLNLLAEAQAAEELRRRDPVKRAIWIGGLVVALVVVAGSSLQFKISSQKDQLNALERQLNLQTNEYHLAQTEKKKLEETVDKLAALRRLATNRFLWATALNAMQQTTVEDVDLLHLKGEQTYMLTEETKARTNELNQVIPAKPATVSERIVLTLRAKDVGPGPGNQITKFKDAIASSPYFQGMLGKTNEVNLTSRQPPQVDPDSGKPCVLFTLECRFPEKVR